MMEGSGSGRSKIYGSGSKTLFSPFHFFFLFKKEKSGK
jgi:hypothetical protein